jgi:phosphate uptake regulator
MEHRKIMALGKSSRVISLPKEWLKRNQLDQGDTVTYQIHGDGSLIVRPTPDRGTEPKRIELSVGEDERPESITRRIIGAFLDGYSIIVLSSERIFTVGQQTAIRDIVRRLYMMVINSEAKRTELETLIDESKASVSSCVERMHLITYSMLRDTIESLRNWDAGLVNSVISLEDDVDQLNYLVLRIIRSAAVKPSLANELGLDPLDCLDYQALVNHIERAADCVIGIAESLSRMIEERLSLPQEAQAILVNAAEIAFDSYSKAVECYLHMDIEPTNGVIDRQDDIRRLYMEITPLPRFSEAYDAPVLSNIVTIRENVMKISDLAADIAELTIDRAYKHRAEAS